MDQARFDQLIDARFPYLDRGRARAMIFLGASISPECGFQVLHEIARLPSRNLMRRRSMRLIQRDLLAIWQRRVRHPLAGVVAECAQSLIDDRPLSAKRTAWIMKAIACYPNQGSALNVAYFACKDFDESDRLRDAVVHRWGWTAS